MKNGRPIAKAKQELPIKKLIQQAFCKNSEAAKELDIAEPTLYCYFNGTRQPKLEIARRICDILKSKGIDCTLEDVYRERTKKA